MASGTGHFDKFGNVCLKFHLCGVVHAEPGLEFTGIIDTGFTGFIQLPLQHAFSLKLPLEGTTSYTMADGNQTVCLTALAKTTFADRMKLGVVTLAIGSQDTLVGMGFLRQFKLGLVVVKSAVVLVDEEELEHDMEKQAEGTAQESQPEANEPELTAPPAPSMPGPSAVT
jgi:predicted aspartyl protease